MNEAALESATNVVRGNMMITTPSRTPPRPFPRTPSTFLPSPSSEPLPRRCLARRSRGRGTDVATNLKSSCLGVDFCTFLYKFPSLLVHSGPDRLFLSDTLFGGVSTNILRYLHAAEVRAAHGAEVRGLCAFLRQC